MPKSFKQFGLRAMETENPPLLRRIALAVAAAIEPFYASVMRVRNACYDAGIFKSHHLGRFTISVGNITTGGTGKTPVVMWLANQLRDRGKHPSILLRGYGSKPNQPSDEAMLLDQGLNDSTDNKVPVKPNPSRVDGAAQVLADFPPVDLFLLDDGFQHRRAARDFNLVLISASCPFGFGRVLPRGLLREPIRGLARADAFVITRCSSVPPEQLAKIESVLQQKHPTIPVYHADHLVEQAWMSDTQQSKSIASLTHRRFFTALGIGDPLSFIRQVEAAGCSVVSGWEFADHHSFTATDVKNIMIDARRFGCDTILVTEKDWVKIKRVSPAADDLLPFAVAKLTLVFCKGEGSKLLASILSAAVPGGVEGSGIEHR